MKTLFYMIFIIWFIIIPRHSYAEKKFSAVVIPFVNKTGSEDYSWLKDNLSAAITRYLEKNGKLSLSNKSSSVNKYFTGKNLPAKNILSSISDETGTDIIIYGDYKLLNNSKIFVQAYIYHSYEKETGSKFESVFALDSKMFESINDISKQIAAGISSPEPPVDITATNNEYPDKIILQWSKSKNAKKYIVYKAKEANGTYVSLDKISSQSYDDKTVKPGEKFFYKIKSVTLNGESDFSSEVSGTTSFPVPEISVKEESIDKIIIVWKYIDNASGYDIYRSPAGDSAENYDLLQTINANQYTDTAIVSGQEYLYKIRAVNNFTTGAFSNTIKACGALRPPADITVNIAENAITIKWSAIQGADEYIVMKSLSDNSGFTEAGKSAAVEFSDNAIKPGKKYYYKIKSSGKNRTSEESVTVSGIIPLGKPEIKATDQKKGKVVITWNKIDGAENYSVYRSSQPDSDDTEIAKVDDNNFDDTGAEPGKTYFYKVKPVTPDYTGEFSNTAEGKVQKLMYPYYLRGIVPGWAQIYAGKNIKGYIFAGTFGAATLGAVGTSIYYFKTKDDYNKIPSSSTKEEFDAAYNKYATASLYMNTFIGITAVVYAANWVDVIFFSRESYINAGNNIYRIDNSSSICADVNVDSTRNVSNQDNKISVYYKYGF